MRYARGLAAFGHICTAMESCCIRQQTVAVSPVMQPDDIRQRREKLKMTPTQFGQALGLTEKGARITVWRWETGDTKPSTQTIMLMKQLRPSKRKTK